MSIRRQIREAKYNIGFLSSLVGIPHYLLYSMFTNPDGPSAFIPEFTVGTYLFTLGLGVPCLCKEIKDYRVLKKQIQSNE